MTVALASTTQHRSSSFQVGVLPRVKIRLVPQNDKQKNTAKKLEEDLHFTCYSVYNTFCNLEIFTFCRKKHIVSPLFP
jgi:hypothetical protein